MEHDARARGTHRMPERNGAAIDVQPVLIQRAERAVQPELLAAVALILPRRETAEDLGSERFVDFPVVEIVETEAMALQDRRRRMHRAEAHLRRVESRPFGIDDAPERLQIALAQRLLIGKKQPGGAIGDLRAVAGSDVAVFAIEERP